MSKSRKGLATTTAASTAIAKEQKDRIKQIVSAAAAWSKKHVHVYKCITALLFTAGAILAYYEPSSIMLGGLYIYADNGKKSGRWDGNVYMVNGRTRGFTKPSIVNNIYTAAVKAVFSLFSSAWESLTDGNRESWNNMTWWSKTDRVGHSHIVKGKNAYVGLNSNITLVAGTPITDAPAGGGETTFPLDFAAVADQSLNTIVVNATAAGFGTSVKATIEATAPQPAGVSRPKKSAFRQLDPVAVVDSGTTFPLDITTAYQTKFGAAWDTVPYLGKKIFFAVTPIQSETGNSGSPLIFVAVIQA